MSVLIGIDVGATTISGGLVSKDGETLAVVSEATAARAPGSAVETVRRVIDELVAWAGRRHLALDGVGIGLPGLVDAEKGMMTSTMNQLPEFAHVPLADNVRARTGLPAFVDNDVNAQALGEWTFGVGRHASSLVLLALGTGVGGSIIIDGTLLRGHSGSAGEFGHVSIDLDGLPCLCGGRGCVDHYLGGRNLAEEARRRVARDPGSVMLSLAGGDPNAISAEVIFAAAAADDSVARAIVDQACRALGATIALIVNTINPEVLVVTGGVMRSLVPLESEIRRHVALYALDHALAGTRITLTPTDKRNTVRGGAALVRYELDRRAATRAPATVLVDPRG